MPILNATDHQGFTYSKGYIDDPGVIPRWERKLSAYPAAKRPQVELTPPTTKPLTRYPTSVQWWWKEVEWMNKRLRPDANFTDVPMGRALGTGMLPISFFGPWRNTRQILPWLRTFEVDERSYANQVAVRSDTWVTAEPTLTDLAVLMYDDIGAQFFIERAAELARGGALTNSPGVYFRGNGTASSRSLLDVIEKLVQATQAAMEVCFTEKWTHLLARPEEVWARSLRDLSLVGILQMPRGTRLQLLYPDGAPRHPAFPSGHAAIAGACAYVLLRALGDPSGQTQHGRSVVVLAEQVFMGRWAAGVHWICDGIAGLDLGWKVARAMLDEHNVHPASPWAPLMANWFPDVPRPPAPPAGPGTISDRQPVPPSAPLPPPSGGGRNPVPPSG